jgi:hypothetical protein
LRELERAKQFEAMKNENLLPIVGDQLALSGFVFTQIEDGSDNYMFAICTPDAFKLIESLTVAGYSIRRFGKATFTNA